MGGNIPSLKILTNNHINFESIGGHLHGLSDHTKPYRRQNVTKRVGFCVSWKASIAPGNACMVQSFWSRWIVQGLWVIQFMVEGVWLWLLDLSYAFQFTVVLWTTCIDKNERLRSIHHCTCHHSPRNFENWTSSSYYGIAQPCYYPSTESLDAESLWTEAG
jgi:hypothetical protein